MNVAKHQSHILVLQDVVLGGILYYRQVQNCVPVIYWVLCLALDERLLKINLFICSIGIFITS